MPKTRTTHVRRIKNADNEEVWIDVERVDEIISKQEGQGGLYRKTTRLIEWGDETDDAAHPTREMTELRVEDPEDPDTFVLINVIDKQKTRRGQGPDYKKKHKWFFNDKDTNTAREVSFRRVYHWDTETDPNDDGGTEYVRIEGTEDRDQYVDVAVIEKLIQRRGQGPSYKKRTYQFNTEPIKEFSEESPGDVDPATVVWLDPRQNIVNVQWETTEFVAFAISIVLVWEPTEEFVFYSTAPCGVSTGHVPFGTEYNTTSTIHFIADDADVGAPVNSGSAYTNGEWVAGGGPITGLEYPFPKSVDLSPWQFVGVHVTGPETPVVDLEFEEADGEIILDRNGDPVEAFPGEAYRRADSVEFNALGQAYLSGPACMTTDDFPIIPRQIGFPENIVGLQLVTPIPQAAETISISSITVEYKGKTFQGCGYWADLGALQIICEKVTE